MQLAKAKARFSQNFLINKGAISKILQATDLSGKRVLEIGPGRGALTGGLLQQASAVVAYEIDPEMIAGLVEKYGTDHRFSIVPGDVLERPFDCINNCVLVGNIPYHITTPILFKIFTEISKFSAVVLMVQQEFADRLLAKVGSSTYGKLTISAQHYGDIKRVTNVSRNSFLPAPNVDSTVILITPFSQLRPHSTDFLQFINQCFQFRRKTLVNNLKGIVNETLLLRLLSQHELPAKVRPQNVSYEIFWQLFTVLILNSDQ